MQSKINLKEIEGNDKEQKTMKLKAEKKIKNYKLKSLFFHKYL